MAFWFPVSRQRVTDTYFPCALKRSYIVDNSLSAKGYRKRLSRAERRCTPARVGGHRLSDPGSSLRLRRAWPAGAKLPARWIKRWVYALVRRCQSAGSR